jgi:hypothetical protein
MRVFVTGASDFFGSAFFSMDVPATSELTRAGLGWPPVEPGLLTDMDSNHDFATAMRSEAP